MNNKINVALLLIATNKYKNFVPNLINGADKFFLNNENINVEYFLFTDSENDFVSNRKINKIKIQHLPWPFMTLNRYEIFLKSKNELLNFEYLYYIDVDMKFVSNVGEEILSNLVGTRHPGTYQYGNRLTPEENPISTAYIPTNIEILYCAGGFNGGSSKEFIKMSEVISNNIKIDLSKNYIAKWHDESHLNKYYSENKPSLILDSSYCYPENWNNLPVSRRILALDKDHSFYRN